MVPVTCQDCLSPFALLRPCIIHAAHGLQQEIRWSPRPGTFLEPLALTCELTAQDPAPDIYETPDLTDEASTVPVSYRHGT